MGDAIAATLFSVSKKSGNSETSHFRLMFLRGIGNPVDVKYAGKSLSAIFWARRNSEPS